VIALIVGAFVTYIVKWLASKDGEKFKKYEGWAITAVKAAEKAIPDDTGDKGARKLDFALRLFLAKYTKATGVEPDANAVGQIESWVSEIHEMLEEAGVLGRKGGA
jgi:hypothetical protein